MSNVTVTTSGGNEVKVVNRGWRRRLAVKLMIVAAVVGVGLPSGAAVADAVAGGGRAPNTKTINQHGVATDPATAAWVNSLPDQVPVPVGPGTGRGYVNKADLVYPPPLVYGRSIASQLPKTPGPEVHDKSGRHLGWFVPKLGFMSDSQAAAAGPSHGGG